MKKTNRMWTSNIKIILSIVALYALLLNRPSRASAIIDDFANGNGSLYSDQYPGVAGNGWLTAWTISTGGSGSWSTTASVINTVPLSSGSGNYFSVSTGSSSTTGTGYFGVIRQHDTSVVDLSQSLTYTFDYRINNSASADYQYAIFSSTAAENSTSSNNTWYIKSTLNNGWQIAGTTYSTGVSIITGDTYRFTITVNPASKNYTVTISDLTATTSFTSGTLNFRNSITSDGSYLCFTILDDQKSSADTYGFSIDNITIASIPELPGSSYVLIFCLIFSVFYFHQKCESVSFYNFIFFKK